MKGSIGMGSGPTTSIHANLFPLAFGLVPAEHQQSVADYVCPAA